MARLADMSLGSDANLEGYWKMDDDWTDESSNGYDLTPSGTPTFVTGKYGNAGNFVAASSQFASIANASCPNLEIAGSHTWVAWIYIDTYPASSQVIMSKGVITGQGQQQLLLGSTGNIQHTTGGLSDTSVISSGGGLTPVAEDSWALVAGIVDVENDTIGVYINGHLYTEPATGDPLDTNAPFYLGARRNAGDTAEELFFNGIIDEAAVFSRALSKAELDSILEIYTKGDESSLPTTNADLETSYNATDYTNVSSDNGTRVSQTGTLAYMLHEFKDYIDDSGATFSWNGQSSLAPSSSTVLLQIYNHDSDSWETIDSDNSSSANTDFDLSATVSNLTNYKDEYNVVTCRVYQQAT